MRTALVTGGAGFIGSHLAARLLKNGTNVRILDNFSSGFGTNISKDVLGGEVELIEGDIRDEALCRKAVADTEVVFHLAAVASVPKSVAEPVFTHEVNIDGSLKLLSAARDARVKRFVFASSSAVYGDDPVQPKTENMPPNPISPYALHKLTIEHYLKLFYNLYGFETVALRYFNVFGPRQNPNSEYAAVIPKFITRMIRSQPPIVFGDGLQTRDFIYVEDVAEANILAATAPQAPGKVINIACGHAVNLLQLINTINNVLQTSFKAVTAPPQPGDIKHSTADISPARNILNFKPSVTFEEGIRRTIDWYKKHAAI